MNTQRDHGDHRQGHHADERALGAEEDRDGHDGQELPHGSGGHDQLPNRPSSRWFSRRMGSRVPSAVVVNPMAIGTNACTKPAAARAAGHRHRH